MELVALSQKVGIFKFAYWVGLPSIASYNVLCPTKLNYDVSHFLS